MYCCYFCIFTTLLLDTSTSRKIQMIGCHGLEKHHCSASIPEASCRPIIDEMRSCKQLPTRETLSRKARWKKKCFWNKWKIPPYIIITLRLFWYIHCNFTQFFLPSTICEDKSVYNFKKYTYTHTHIYIYLYVYIQILYICVYYL